MVNCRDASVQMRSWKRSPAWTARATGRACRTSPYGLQRLHQAGDTEEATPTSCIPDSASNLGLGGLDSGTRVAQPSDVRNGSAPVQLSQGSAQYVLCPKQTDLYVRVGQAQPLSRFSGGQILHLAQPEYGPVSRRQALYSALQNLFEILVDRQLLRIAH